MIRKIKRIQAALHAQSEPDYEAEEDPPSTQRRRGRPGHHNEEITSSPHQASQIRAAQAKLERMSQTPDPSQMSMVPNSQVVDLEEDEDEEDDEY